MVIISSYLKQYFVILHIRARVKTYMKKTLLFFLSIAAFVFTSAQDFSNKGKDFWVGYGSHVNMYSGNGGDVAGGGTQELVLYFKYLLL